MQRYEKIKKLSRVLFALFRSNQNNSEAQGFHGKCKILMFGLTVFLTQK